MAETSYDQAWRDHQYLWLTYAEADDMTGGYVDSEDLKKLLRTPTRATARDCLCSQIAFWFQNGPATAPGHIPWDDPRVREIAERHCIERISDAARRAGSFAAGG